MRVISSRWTFFYKYIFPLLWFGFLGMFVATSLIARDEKQSFDPQFVIAPLIMMVVGWFIWRKLARELADEVRDAGNALIVRKSGEEARIPLGEIINVDSQTGGRSTPRLVLSLRTPCRFGSRIAFVPVDERGFFSFRFLAPNPLAAELIERIDKARRQS